VFRRSTITTKSCCSEFEKDIQLIFNLKYIFFVFNNVINTWTLEFQTKTHVFYQHIWLKICSAHSHRFFLTSGNSQIPSQGHRSNIEPRKYSQVRRSLKGASGRSHFGRGLVYANYRPRVAIEDHVQLQVIVAAAASLSAWSCNRKIHWHEFRAETRTTLKEEDIN
jgi:hypothetical protein